MSSSPVGHEQLEPGSTAPSSVAVTVKGPQVGAMAAEATGSSSDLVKETTDVLSSDKELMDSLDQMADFVRESSVKDVTEAASPDSKFASLRLAVQARSILSGGFGASKHVYESEGSDALLFFQVPKWIAFTKISGCRYRQITNIVDGAVDEWDEQRQGVTFFGYPGASGWADKIGDVAIHYMHHDWAVFSKVFPFDEQKARRTAHEDILLLGSTKHVMLTPSCARDIGPKGLNSAGTNVTLLNSEGSIADQKTASAAKLPGGVRHRLYLTWGHPDSSFASEVSSFERPLQELLDENKTEPWGKKAKRFFNNLVGARIKVGENWMRYPGASIDPAYYHQIISTVVGMTSAEEATRELLEPLPSSRGDGGAQPSQVTIDMDSKQKLVPNDEAGLAA